jgi:hypothetical protein
MIRDRVEEPWRPSRAEIEAMIAEQTSFEEDWLAQGRITLWDLCAKRFLPGVTERPLYTGRAPIRVDWTRFPRRRRTRLADHPPMKEIPDA